MTFVSPEQIVKNLGLEAGMIVADFGSGSGHYSIEAAKIVGKAGRVYAIDIQKEMLQAVKSRGEISGLENIEIIWADLEIAGSSKLPDNSIDAVIISNILFQSGAKENIAKEAFRILKSGGRLGVIEWLTNSGKIGPSGENRISFDTAVKIFSEVGFGMVNQFDAGDNHYGILFKKKHE